MNSHLKSINIIFIIFFVCFGLSSEIYSIGRGLNSRSKRSKALAEKRSLKRDAEQKKKEEEKIDAEQKKNEKFEESFRGMGRVYSLEEWEGSLRDAEQKKKEEEEKRDAEQKKNEEFIRTCRGMGRRYY